MRFLVLTIVILLAFEAIHAKEAGSIAGVVRDSATGELLEGITVTCVEVKKTVATSKEGEFQFSFLADGRYSIKVTGIGWMPVIKKVEVRGTESAKVEFMLVQSAQSQGEIIVYAASRRQEKLTGAPAALSVVSPLAIEQGTAHGSVGKTMEHLVGVDVVQNGSNDFNINSRGFNNSINRRMLVLIDGRDPSTPLINLNEWNSLSSLLGDIATIEVVHGPGSALYGQNAYNGVVNIRTSDPRDVLGTRVSLTAGEWETYKGSIRHAGEMGDLAYKLTFGYSQQLNYSIVSRLRDSTKPNNGLEYPGLAYDVRPLTDDARRPFAIVGTARLDYHLDTTSRLLFEGGYSNSGNEFYVNQTGRILIQQVTRPFARVAYNSDRINVQALWQNRTAPKAQLVYNAMATSGEKSDVLSIDAQYNNTYLNDKLRIIVGAQHERQYVNTTYDYQVTPPDVVMPLLSPDDQFGTFTGGYTQAEFRAAASIKLVGALRVDGSNLFETQISPKAGVVFEPATGQSFRLTYNRSFLRPSFADFYRKSPAGPPVNLAGVEATVDSVTSQIVGQQVSSNLNLGVTPQWNLGNPTLVPEKAQSIEIGYRGTPINKVFVDVSGYFNQRTDLISAPLGGLAPNVFPPVESNTGNDAWNHVADSVLAAELAKINPNFPARLATYNSSAALVIAPTNIAVVNEMGAEISAGYFITNELSVSANYAYLDVTVKDNSVSAQKILPNTSRHRINGALEYIDPGKFDAGIQLRYVEGFQWIAGLFEGRVPSYAVLNLNAGYYVLPELRASISVFNLLDREHYEIFGGTILRRQATGTLTYTFR
ncbi:MAG: TonB-dependent receptor [Ignavibacteria bacterium]|nr:TonB-dependent receptor [Ignavibacteria bacterium]